MRIVITGFGFFILFLGLSLPVAGLAQGPGGNKPTPVIVSPVEMENITDKVEALGTLKANESVDISSTVTEKVTAILFEDGQRVREGDILIEMDAAEERAELQEQQSFLNEAERQVERLEPLVEQGAASASDLDVRKRELQTAEARIQAIQSRLDQRVIKAPYGGVVGLRNISVGALAQPGTLITTLDDISVMKLDFSVPEVFMSTLEKGVEIEATTRAFPTETFRGTISSVSNRVDPVTRAIEARALIENPDLKLKPGMLMLVELQKSPRKTLVIPEESIVPEGSKNFVLVIQKDGEQTTAERREVEIGTRQYGKVEILNGLSEVQQVVVHGTLRVRPGAPLEITAVEREDTPLNELLTGAGPSASPNSDGDE